MVKECMIPRFLDCFYAGCRDEKVKAFVDEAAAVANYTCRNRDN